MGGTEVMPAEAFSPPAKIFTTGITEEHRERTQGNTGKVGFPRASLCPSRLPVGKILTYSSPSGQSAIADKPVCGSQGSAQEQPMTTPPMVPIPDIYKRTGRVES